jgi:hypothetical protein
MVHDSLQTPPLVPAASQILIPVALGAALGALMGTFGQCTSGTCPLTSTWWRGAIYGAFLGLLSAFVGRTH